MKSSRFYQNWLQVVARGSTLFLFLSGAFFGTTTENIMLSLLFLGFNLAAGFAGSHLKYRRLQVIVREYNDGVVKKLRPSKYYQNWLQFLGRGKDVFVFFLGFLLGQGFWFLSIILLIIQLLNGIFLAELVYLREQAVIREKPK